MYVVRPFESLDIHHLINIDIKADNEPYTVEEWEWVLENQQIHVLTKCETPVGFITLFDTIDLEIAWIGKLSTLPDYDPWFGAIIEIVSVDLKEDGKTSLRIIIEETELELIDKVIKEGFNFNKSNQLDNSSYYVFHRELTDENAET